MKTAAKNHGGHFPRWINGRERGEARRAGDGKDQKNQAHTGRS
jgi:hypothetical protein